jgi:GGDEF domain-containing protein
VACMPDHAKSGEELMHAADVALYEAKHAGRNAVRMYREEVLTR